MAYFKFTNKIVRGEPIQIYNHGDMLRDFTYVDDIVRGVENMLCNPPKANEFGDRYKVYNIGNNRPEKLMDFIETLEKAIAREAKKEYLPMQPGDVYQTYADVTDLIRDFDFKPSTSIAEGLGPLPNGTKTITKNKKKSSAEVISRAFFMGNGLTLPPLPGTVERNGAWKGAEMMEEARQGTLWVPQREDAYKAHGEILRRFSQNKVPGISIQRRWRREAQVWGFSV